MFGVFGVKHLAIFPALLDKKFALPCFDRLSTRSFWP